MHPPLYNPIIALVQLFNITLIWNFPSSRTPRQGVHVCYGPVYVACVAAYIYMMSCRDTRRWPPNTILPHMQRRRNHSALHCPSLRASLLLLLSASKYAEYCSIQVPTMRRACERHEAVAP